MPHTVCQACSFLACFPLDGLLTLYNNLRYSKAYSWNILVGVNRNALNSALTSSMCMSCIAFARARLPSSDVRFFRNILMMSKHTLDKTNREV